MFVNIHNIINKCSEIYNNVVRVYGSFSLSEAFLKTLPVLAISSLFDLCSPESVTSSDHPVKGHGIETNL